jgi:hypothetical protein
MHAATGSAGGLWVRAGAAAGASSAPRPLTCLTPARHHHPCRCANDCGYCGIRKHQRDVVRYTMPRDEVVKAAKWAFENKMGTLMLQARARARAWRGTSLRVH